MLLCVGVGALVRPPVRPVARPVVRPVARPAAPAAEGDGGVGAAIDAGASSLASSAAVAAATLPATRRSLALWRVGWFSWWGQCILSVVSAVVLAFARASAPAPAPSAVASGFLMACVGAGLGFASVAWTWRLTRLARALPASPSVADGEKLLAKTRGALRAAARLNLVGMALTLVSAQQVVGTLIAKSLVAPGAMNNLLTTAGVPAAVQAVTALDVFVIQANTNTLCAHFLGLFASLGLLSRSEKW